MGDPLDAIENAPTNNRLVSSNKESQVALASRPDGLVREVKEKQVVSREEVNELLETEDVQNFGDFSDEVRFSMTPNTCFPAVSGLRNAWHCQVLSHFMPVINTPSHQLYYYNTFFANFCVLFSYKFAALQ